VLDIGCGTGYLLRLLARQWPQELAGIDPAPSMIEAAAGPARDERLRFSIGAAEGLPCPAAPLTSSSARRRSTTGQTSRQACANAPEC